MLVDINLLSEKERDRPAFVVAAILLILFGLVTGLVFYLLGNSYATKQLVIAAQSTSAQSASFHKRTNADNSALNDTKNYKRQSIG
jgi:type IV pilus assembly protein PilN